QINKDQRKDESKQQAVRTFSEFFGYTRQFGTEGFIQYLCSNAIHLIQTIANGIAFSKAGRNRCTDEPVISIKLWRCALFFNGDQVVKLHETSILGSHIERGEIYGLVSIFLLHFAHYLILLAVHDKEVETLP